MIVPGLLFSPMALLAYTAPPSVLAAPRGVAPCETNVRMGPHCRW